MFRKAQALPMNTVIIAILVVLVLFVVGSFFLGGTGGITKTIRQIFFGTVAGQDMVFALQTCGQRCQSLNVLPTEAIPDSAYCKQAFFIDEDRDGEADYVPGSSPKVYNQYFCYIQGDSSRGIVSLDAPCVLENNGHGPDKFCARGYTGR